MKVCGVVDGNGSDRLEVDHQVQRKGRLEGLRNLCGRPTYQVGGGVMVRPVPIPRLTVLYPMYLEVRPATAEPPRGCTRDQ